MVDLQESPSLQRAPSATLPTEVAALSTLFPRVATATTGVIVAFAVMRGAHGSKTWDKAIYVVPIVLATMLCIHLLRRPTRHVASVTAVCTAVALLVGIGQIERQAEHVTVAGVDLRLPQLFWEGFGVPVAVATLILSVLLWRAMDRIQTSRTLRGIVTAAVAVVCVGDLASLIRTLSNFAYPNNNVYMLNEILAPAAGRVPDSTFVAQYTSLYGWLLVPLRHFMSARGLAQFAMIFFSVLGILSVVLAVKIAARCMSSPSLWLAAGIVVPLTCVTVAHDAGPYYLSSIGSYVQQLPIRLFPSMLFSLLGLEALVRVRAGTEKRWHLPALGILGGLIVWNSQDFGVAVAAAFTLFLAVGLPPARLRASISQWLYGLFGGLALYPLLCLLAGTPLRLAYFGIFSRAFANGFDSSPIQVPGPVLLVFPLLVAGTSVGWCLLVRLRRQAPSDSGGHERAVLTLAFVGTWTTAGFAYYLNRSYASGQLQVLLMPCGVCIVALTSLCRDAQLRLRRSGALGRINSSRISLSFWPIAIAASLGFASMLQSPNPVTVWRSLTNPPAAVGFTSELIPLSTIQTAESYVSSRGGSLGYFGTNGSYVHLLTGLPDLLLLDHPIQFDSSPILRNYGCKYLAQHATQWIVAYAPDVSIMGPDSCGLYTPVDVDGLPPRSLFVRTITHTRADSPLNQIQVATLSVSLAPQYPGNVHAFDVTINPCDGTFTGVSSPSDSVAVGETIRGTVRNGRIDFAASYNGDTYTWGGSGPLAAFTGKDNGTLVFNTMKASITGLADVSDYHSHAAFAFADPQEADAAHACIGLPGTSHG
jgi:hypothetical protein